MNYVQHPPKIKTHQLTVGPQGGESKTQRLLNNEPC